MFGKMTPKEWGKLLQIHVDYHLRQFAASRSDRRWPDANSSFFYPKTKGEGERDMKLVGFQSLTILRPSIIGGRRNESRFAEGLALTLSRRSLQLEERV